MWAGARRRLLTTFSWALWLPIVHRTADRRTVSLTFDDGPSRETTPGLLERLGAYDVRATFFLCGARVASNPALVAAIVAAGHDVYAHGYSHLRLDTLSDADAIDEMEATEALLCRHRPTPSPYLVRLPYGSGHGSARIHRLLRRWRPDCQIAHWGYDFKDFRLSERCTSTGQLEERCETAVAQAAACRSFGGSVLLLHDDPIGAEGRFVPLIATTLLDRLMAALARDGMGVTSMRPLARHSLAARCVRTVAVQ